jgi:membrane protease YdiL (CAAX protease family)
VSLCLELSPSPIITAFIGLYLGLLWLWTGNLLTPMITHAVYDILALVYFLRVYRIRVANAA